MAHPYFESYDKANGHYSLLYISDGAVPNVLSTDYKYVGKEGQSPMDITEKMTKGLKAVESAIVVL